MKYRSMPDSDALPYALYRADQIRDFDRLAMEGFGLSGDLLMERAGIAAWALLEKTWPEASRVTIVTGRGNNAGDGFVVARLAQLAGRLVRVLQLGESEALAGDAEVNRQRFIEIGGSIEPAGDSLGSADVIVDAILGTGLGRPVSGAWAEAIASINAHPAPVLALDIPSGLHADTGRVMGECIHASHSISFVGLKQGMFTAQGPDCSGQVHFSALQIPAQVYASRLLSCRRIDWNKLRQQLPRRSPGMHKGQAGHVLVVGGSPGFAGAAHLTSVAAARAGAGLVSLATVPEHGYPIQPEIMVHGIVEEQQLRSLVSTATVIAIGPGLGRGDWGRMAWRLLQDCEKPMVVDADALRLLAEHPVRRDGWVLTPHPGEAAALLGMDAGRVQDDRFAALNALTRRYGGVVALKGAGTLIGDCGSRPPGLCSDGNPGMASGGMGDLLTGIIAGLLAQGLDAREATEMAVCVHARAADLSAQEQGGRGMLASDLFSYIRRLVN